MKLKRLEPLQGYEGIFNGTSNYILDSMQKNNLDFEDVLKQAQEKGYAEKDPSMILMALMYTIRQRFQTV